MPSIAPHISTPSAVLPPAATVQVHLRRASELADALGQELSAAAAASVSHVHAAKLAALARACTKLDFAFAALRRNHAQ